MSSLLTEAILFLKENIDLWSIADIRKVLLRVKNNERLQRALKKLQELNGQEANIAVQADALGIQNSDSGSATSRGSEPR